MRKLLLATCLCLPMTAQAAVLHYEAGLDPLAPDPRFGFNLTVSDSLFVTNPVDVAGSTHCDPLNGCQYDGSWNLFIFDPVLRSQYLIASLDLALLDHHVVSGTVHSDNGLGDQFDVSLRNGTWHTDWVTGDQGPAFSDGGIWTTVQEVGSIPEPETLSAFAVALLAVYGVAKRRHL
jgi:hypothetical protein